MLILIGATHHGGDTDSRRASELKQLPPGCLRFKQTLVLQCKFEKVDLKKLGGKQSRWSKNAVSKYVSFMHFVWPVGLETLYNIFLSYAVTPPACVLF